MTASRFEAIRVAFRQDKDGYVITLRIHPSDIDGQIMQDPVGQRYYVTLNRVDEDEQPITPKEKTSGEILVQQAGILCKDPEFRAWMHRRGHAFDASEESVIKGLRDMLGLESRAELALNDEAQTIFRALLKEYGR
jgi:hypothetical protein